MKNKAGSFMVSFFVLLAGVLLMMAERPALAQDGPTFAKNSVRASVKTSGTAWVPETVQFQVKGPVPDGSQFLVDFALPTNKQWAKFTCDAREFNNWWSMACPGDKVSERDKVGSVTFTGLVDFTIHVSNELAGTNITLFKGKMKVGKFLPYPKVTKYYVDEDWRIPIGYVFLKDSTLHTSIWFRGNWPGDSMGYLFYQGKQVAKTVNYCSGALGVEEYMAKYMWGPNDCGFGTVYGADPSDGHFATNEPYDLRKNPGEYEIKVMASGHVARSIKFTVDANGIFDSGIATNNKLGDDRVIVPVQVIGAQDGVWDHAAWKTGAFYGNPLTGFAAVP